MDASVQVAFKGAKGNRSITMIRIISGCDDGRGKRKGSQAENSLNKK